MKDLNNYISKTGSVSESVSARELKEFKLPPTDRDALNKARRICVDLRRKYDYFHGRKRDDIMAGAYDVINGIDDIMNAQ